MDNAPIPSHSAHMPCNAHRETSMDKLLFNNRVKMAGDGNLLFLDCTMSTVCSCKSHRQEIYQ